MKINFSFFLFYEKDLCHMEKTCGTKEIASTRSKLHKILIPKVRSKFRENIFQKLHFKNI